jgi:hypothetical protein
LRKDAGVDFCGREQDERPDAEDRSDEGDGQQLDAGVLD